MTKKQEDRAMNRMIQSAQQSLIFFMLFTWQIQPNSEQLHLYIHQIRTEQDEASKLSIEDEKLLQELWLVTSDFYKKIIETMVLYFSGMLLNSDQFHKQLILETSKHALYASQIIAQYLPKLLQNPKISWKEKVKRCAYVTSFLVIVLLCLKEFCKQNVTPEVKRLPPNLNNFQLPTIENQHDSHNLQPRQRPSLH